jgi:hypothetical protein
MAQPPRSRMVQSADHTINYHIAAIAFSLKTAKNLTAGTAGF